MKNKLFILLGLVVLAAVGYFLYTNYFSDNTTETAISQQETKTIKTAPEKTTKKKQAAYITPVDEFKSRITKKKFGTYITPANSPVQPERFSGYHTGVDVEYDDIISDTPVRALTSGTVTFSGVIDGYGGVLLITHTIKGAPRTVVYGHLDPSSLPTNGSAVKKSQKIGVLGANKSSETDGERKHLHFAILSDTRQDFLGYVQSEGELSAWLNPLSLY